MKDVMINCYEGCVRINNAPNNARKDDVINITKSVLQEHLNNRTYGRNEPLVRLSNVDYLTEKQMHEYFEELDYIGVEPNYISVEWDDYK